METPTILDKDNYVVWSNQVKSNLAAQNLWSIVESSSKPSKQKDNEVAFADWNEKNLKALQMIWNSCGSSAYLEIHYIDSVHITWSTLQEKYSMPDVVNNLNKDNYLNWSDQVKFELSDQDLLSIVESTFGPPGEEANEVTLKGWREKNLKALRVIWNACGYEAFEEISTLDSAHVAWITLQNKYGMPSNINIGASSNFYNNSFMKRAHQVKSELEAKELWNIIESASDPPRQEDDEVAFENWRNKNLEALRVIWSFCEWREFFMIKKTQLAKDACNLLVTAFGGPYPIETVKGFLKAVQHGEWDEIEEFLKCHPSLLNARITPNGEMALHIAVHKRRVHIVKKLVELMSKESLQVQNVSGFTALDEASRYGDCQMAKCILTKNSNLIGIEASGNIPLTWAIIFKHKELSYYLYSVTPRKILMRGEAMHGSLACQNAIQARMWDMALDLIRHHQFLAFALDRNMTSPILMLARTPPAFPSGNGLSFWKRWIYSGIHIKLADTTNEAPVNIPSGQVLANGSVRALFHQLLSDLHNLLGLKHLYEIKLAYLQYREILYHICEEIPDLDAEQMIGGCVIDAIFLAIKEGNFEFVYEIVRRNPNLIWSRDEDGSTIFMAAVRYRQAKIFSLIYQLDAKDLMLACCDNGGNYTLHVAGMLAPSSELDHLPGPAVQMQRELQWFKEVERISLESFRQKQNDKRKTADEVFMESHKNLRQMGEKWMRDTATFCSVINVLIAAMMFGALFRVPDGNNQSTGVPIFILSTWFRVFLTFAYTSIVCSGISQLGFLGILASGCLEKDFLQSLFRNMIIGFYGLGISFTAMVVASWAAIVPMFGAGTFTPLFLLCGLVGGIVCALSITHFPILSHMLNLIFRPTIFNRKMECWF